MSSTVEQETDDVIPTENELVLEVVEVREPEAEPQEAGVESMSSQPEAIDARELKAILEAVLFVSPEPVPVARLMSILGSVSKAEVVHALDTLTYDLDQEGRGIQLVQVAGGYRLVTKQEYGPWLKRMDKAKTAQKLSRSALESLAIIAYKQPLVRSEIEEIRGVETSGVLRTLCERKLVRIVGRKEVPGRPIMYGTTKFFLEHFGLQDLTQLPPLREFKELGESEQALLPIEHESLLSVETSEPSYSEDLPVTSDLMEGEAVLAFDVETDETVLEASVEEPVEQA
ncbi:MAG: SMC-Scp complex subunit ScpB [Nitrospirota bacterium]|nr:SMC-Scp complex subunit ScpB [Nitrospirota bacterium]MDP2383684.1 SMC-Scp complex subunit ScpB [Nitrospirota bacterium]MDP3596888.1 SMC-Scp complex subunit ScpB [Nitrospirota bacterium]